MSRRWMLLSQGERDVVLHHRQILKRIVRAKQRRRTIAASLIKEARTPAELFAAGQKIAKEAQRG